MTKNDLLKSFFIILLPIFCIFLFINQYDIQFYANGFNKVVETNMQVYYFDVGQASSACAILPNKQVIVIDTGSQMSKDSFMLNVENILNKNKIHKIDYLILTHSDEDHVGGAVALLERYQVDNVLRPKLLAKGEASDREYSVVDTEIYNEVVSAMYKEPDCEVSFIENKTMEIDTAQMRIFAGDKDFYSSTNAYSPFITLQYAGKTFMFTGDVTSARENEFIKTVETQDLTVGVDFLMVAHHGAKDASTEKFLNLINPVYAIISAGDVGHPTVEVLARLNKVGVKEVFVTKQDGMIAIGLMENGAFVVAKMSIYFDLPYLLVVVSIAVLILLNLDYYTKDRRFERYLLRNKKSVSKKVL